MTDKLATVETITNPYKLALAAPKIFEMQKKTGKEAVIDILTKIFYDAGQQIDGKNLSLLAGSLYDDAITIFRNITIEQLRMALANGIRGEYGEFKGGLNIVSFNRWIKAYASSEANRKAKTELDNPNHKPSMSESEAEYEYKQTLLRQFKAYKETGVLNIFMPTMLFRELEERGSIKLSKQEKEKIYTAATLKFISKQKAGRLNPKNRAHFHELSESIKRMESNTPNSHDQQKIKATACETAIKNYYDSISELKL